MTDRPQVDKRWFQNLLADKRIPQAQLAKAIGIHGPAMTRILNGERRLRTEEAIDIARVLGIPVEEVLTHAGVDLPSTGTATAIVRGVVGEHNEIAPDSGHREVEAPQEGLAALEMPKLRWTLFYRPSANVSADAVGRLAMVTLAKEELPRLVFVDRGTKAGVYELKDPATFKLTRDVNLTSASPVLFIRT